MNSLNGTKVSGEQNAKVTQKWKIMYISES